MKIKACRGNLVNLLDEDDNYDFFDVVRTSKVSLKGERHAKSSREELRNTAK